MSGQTGDDGKGTMSEGETVDTSKRDPINDDSASAVMGIGTGTGFGGNTVNQNHIPTLPPGIVGVPATPTGSPTPSSAPYGHITTADAHRADDVPPGTRESGF